jgi:hypothetical protein
MYLCRMISYSTGKLHILLCSAVLRHLGMSFRACSLLQMKISCWNNPVVNQKSHNENNRLHVCNSNHRFSQDRLWLKKIVDCFVVVNV